MNKECLTKWQIEILSNKYREERALLENAITELNRYLRRVSYEMALKQATPTLLGLLQAEFDYQQAEKNAPQKLPESGVG